jgi:hypothetical protein
MSIDKVNITQDKRESSISERGRRLVDNIFLFFVDEYLYFSQIILTHTTNFPPALFHSAKENKYFEYPKCGNTYTWFPDSNISEFKRAGQHLEARGLLCAATKSLCTTTKWLCATTKWLCAATKSLCATTKWLCTASPLPTVEGRGQAEGAARGISDSGRKPIHTSYLIHHTSFASYFQFSILLKLSSQ